MFIYFVKGNYMNMDKFDVYIILADWRKWEEEIKLWSVLSI